MIFIGVQSTGCTIIVVGNDSEFIMVYRRSCLNRSIFVINRDGRQFLAFRQDIGSQICVGEILRFVVLVDELDSACRYRNHARARIIYGQINNDLAILNFAIDDVGDVLNGIATGVELRNFVDSLR